MKLETQRGGHEGGGCAQGVGRTSLPRGPLEALLTQFLRLYIHLYPKIIRRSHQNTFPPQQPSVPVRSHLGAFLGVLSKGDSIMEVFYINTITLPMKREQFSTDLRVHSQQLDAFFSLFDSQYHVLLDVLGDLFDVILFMACFPRSDELWIYDQLIYEYYLNLL